MKTLIFGLSALFGVLVGLVYDLSKPIFEYGPISVSGPAMTAALIVFLLMTSSMTGFYLVFSRLDKISLRLARAPQFDLDVMSNRNPMIEHARSANSTERNLTTPSNVVRLPTIDLQNFDLRAQK